MEQHTLVMYGQPSSAPPLDWSWVDTELERAGTYWVVARTTGQPHPRPVWGVWGDDHLHLSIGSPNVSAQLEHDGGVAVHLDSGTDVVIVEGAVIGATTDASLIERYNDKYDWDYDVEQYGPLTVIQPTRVISWRSAGWAGREGFQQTGRWEQLGRR